MERDKTDAECLTISTNAVHFTVGPEGLCPAFLVFGAIPSTIGTRPSHQKLKRAETIDSAMKAVGRMQEKV